MDLCGLKPQVRRHIPGPSVGIPWTVVEPGKRVGSASGAEGRRFPKQAPPWLASQERYEAFLKLIAMDLGAERISATSIDVEHLDEDRRKDLRPRSRRC